MRLYLLLIAVLLSGSSGEEEPREIPDPTSGTEQVQNLNQPQKSGPMRESVDTTEIAGKQASNESIREIRFEREMVFGSTDETLIGSIATFKVDDKNRVYIADSDQTTIHVFDPEGSYLTSLGREGRGPGEFTAFRSHTIMKVHSNRLYVTDVVGNSYFPSRLQVFSLEDLSFSHTMKLLAGNKDDFNQLEGYYPKRIYPRKDGTFLVSYHRSPNEYKDAESHIRYVVQDSTANIISGPVLEQKDLTHLVHEVTDIRIPYSAIMSFPFLGKSLLVTSDNDHLYAANNTEEFRIDVYDPDGEHLRTFQHAFDNKSLSRSGLIDRYRQLGRGDRILNMIREADNLPDTWPALNDMLIDDQNRLWISTIVEDDDIYEWWVLEATGELLARFDWSRDKEIEVIKNGKLYTLETEEETGLEEVVRYRIEMN